MAFSGTGRCGQPPGSGVSEVLDDKMSSNALPESCDSALLSEVPSADVDIAQACGRSGVCKLAHLANISERSLSRGYDGTIKHAR